MTRTDAGSRRPRGRRGLSMPTIGSTQRPGHSENAPPFAALTAPSRRLTRSSKRIKSVWQCVGIWLGCDDTPTLTLERQASANKRINERTHPTRSPHMIFECILSRTIRSAPGARPSFADQARRSSSGRSPQEFWKDS